MLDGSDSSTTSDSLAKSDSAKQAAAVRSVANRQVGETVKRKNLSPAQRQISDFERLKAIEMYREMRDKKYEKSNLKT